MIRKNKNGMEGVMDVDLSNKSTTEIVDSITEAVGMITQIGMSAAGEKSSHSGAIYVGSTAALYCILPTAPFLAKRPPQAEIDAAHSLPEEEQQAMVRHRITPETIMFTALLSAYCLTEFDAKSGKQETSLTPEVLWNALQAWQKLFPDAKAEDHLVDVVVREARKAGANSTVPFDKLLSDRAKAQGHEPPKSVQ